MLKLPTNPISVARSLSPRVMGDGMLYGSDTEALFAWGLAMTLIGALFCQIFAAPL